MRRTYGTIVVAALLACASRRKTSQATRRVERAVTAPARHEATPEVTVAAADAGVAHTTPEAVADARTWPFVEHARRYCLPDRLARTEYLLKWVPLFHGHLAPGEPLARVDRGLPRASGEEPPDEEDQRRLLDWQGSPRVSHVMDCALPVADLSRKDHPLRTASYAIYLPADYLDHPARARPVLMLVSGGNGNRTRWFLTPTSDRGVVPGTGGLAVRRRVDEWIAAHPEAPPPIVIGLDGSSSQFPNGMAAYIARELPEHVLATYLPGHARAEIAFGVESISSGAVEVARALRADAGAFNTTGFLCPYVHPNGLSVDATFGPRSARDALFQTLAQRRREGTFAMRFSIGAKDDHYPRTWAWYRLLVSAGLFPRPGDAAYERCDEGTRRPGPERCWSTWEGFFLLPHEFHNYRALLPSFGPQFEWELEALADIQRRLGPSPRPPPADAGGGASK